MPLLFFGTRDKSKRRELYVANLRPIETSVFDSFKINDLAPRCVLPNVALFWHMRRRNHSVFAWHDDRGIEQAVFVPGILKQTDMFLVLHDDFRPIMPSPIVFRISNGYEPYDYE